MTTDAEWLDKLRWLTMLRNARLQQEANHSFRELAKLTGLSHTTVANIFKGIANPQRDTITRLVFAITDDASERKNILDTFDEEEQREPADRPHRPATPAATGHDEERTWLDPRSETVMLADAICDLAQAITELADIIKTRRD